jgi:hypothetical protein
MAAAVNLPYESYAKHHTNVFSDMRASIKNTADMFLFGEPTDAMVKLMLNIYHENIVRLCSGRSKNSATMPKLKCMFGIYQDTDDNLYVTISESPGLQAIGNKTTDPSYMAKRAMVLLLLKSAGIKVEFPEEGEGGISKPAPLDQNKWRKDTGEIYDIAEVRKTIEAAENLTANMLYLTAEESATDVYPPEIRNMSCGEEECVVNWIDSVDYLHKRGTGEPTFRPFKKWNWKAGKADWVAECNNGHLCTESKLFAYAKLKGLKHKSFVAYWIGNELPPNKHIMANYSYRMGPGVPEEEQEKLELLKDRCDAVLNLPAGFRDGHPSYTNTIRSVVQPIAVACPGCFANIQSYITGTMVAWNQSNCYSPRTHAPQVTGGGRSRKRKASKKAKKTRRRKSRK